MLITIVVNFYNHAAMVRSNFDSVWPPDLSPYRINNF